MAGPDPSQAGTTTGKAIERAGSLRDTQEAMAYLAEQTGGFAILNTKDLARRLREDCQRHSRLLPDRLYAGRGHVCPSGQAAVVPQNLGSRAEAGRSGAHAEGVPRRQRRAGHSNAAQQLVRAAISPFTATDISLRVTALPGYAPDSGPFVRALLHVDASALTFTDAEDGRKRASADLVGMAFDDEGLEVAHLSTGFSVELTDKAAEDAPRDGLAYTLRIPIRRPGAYQLRFAIRDGQSGKLGSAGEFVDVPDVRGGVFALSGIVLHGGEEPGSKGTEGADPIAIPPAEALRSYRAGTPLTYVYEIYNASAEVRVATTVWRGEEKVLAVPAEILAPPAGHEGRFAAKGILNLGKAMPAGTYPLQLSALTPDPKKKGRLRTALQRIDFDVR